MKHITQKRDSTRIRQHGSADHETLMTVLAVVSLLTIGYLVLGLIRSIKDDRVERDRTTYIEQYHRKPLKRDQRGPSGHQLVM